MKLKECLETFAAGCQSSENELLLLRRHSVNAMARDETDNNAIGFSQNLSETEISPLLFEICLYFLIYEASAESNLGTAFRVRSHRSLKISSSPSTLHFV